MYMELIDPVLGEIDVQFQNIQSASFYQDLTSSSNPAFEVPSGYIDGSSSWAGPSAAYCAPTATGMILPDIVISHHAHSGQSVLTNIAFGSCVFVNVTIYAGPGIAAKALTPEGQPVFQVLISDTDTYSGPSLNVARIFLTASDGMQTSTTFRNVIVIRF